MYAWDPEKKPPPALVQISHPPQEHRGKDTEDLASLSIYFNQTPLKQTIWLFMLTNYLEKK